MATKVKINDYGDHLSKRFKKSLMLIDASKEKHFHSLRHTFAVRSLLQGIPIYDIKNLLGHTSVTTTEVYSNMNLKRVAQDFPSLNRKSVVDNRLVDNTLTEYSHLKQYVKIMAYGYFLMKYIDCLVVLRIHGPSLQHYITIKQYHWEL